MVRLAYWSTKWSLHSPVQVHAKGLTSAASMVADTEGRSLFSLICSDRFREAFAKQDKAMHRP
eukprot:10784-Eustigmatos_ZCMA.PRE.1